jgi:hypothetical protein
MIQIGDVWFDLSAHQFNCGCLIACNNNCKKHNRYCPEHVDKVLDDILNQLSYAQS